ncbi:MAG: hypothetical protein HY466_01715 [Deltaproteobacteria bacterium]|nr:hypothetical protein [Deltaproteobacteria bacterium]
MTTVSFKDLPELSDLLLRQGMVRLRIATGSMRPALREGDEIVVQPAAPETLRVGDILLVRYQGQMVCHRLVKILDSGTFVIRGDAAPAAGGEQVRADQIIGRVVQVKPRTLWTVLKFFLKGLLRSAKNSGGAFFCPPRGQG